MYVVDRTREVVQDVDNALRNYFYARGVSTSLYYAVVVKAILFLIAATLFFSGAMFASKLMLIAYFVSSLTFYLIYFRGRRA